MAHRIVRQLELIPPANEEGERAAAGPFVPRRHWKAPLEQLERCLKLIVGASVRECAGHELGRDAQLDQTARDALVAPRIERSPVCGKAGGEAGVVGISLLAGHVDCRVARRSCHVPRREVTADLSHRAIAPAEMAVGEGQGAIELVVAQAACSAIAASDSASATGRSASIAFTGSRSMPSAS